MVYSSEREATQLDCGNVMGHANRIHAQHRDTGYEFLPKTADEYPRALYIGRLSADAAPDGIGRQLTVVHVTIPRFGITGAYVSVLPEKGTTQPRTFLVEEPDVFEYNATGRQVSQQEAVQLGEWLMAAAFDDPSLVNEMRQRIQNDYYPADKELQIAIQADAQPLSQPATAQSAL